FAFHKLAATFPQFLESYNNPKDFLKSVESIIHVEVKKMYKDAYTPSFKYTDPAPDKLIIQYHSKRKLYALMEGLINGVGEHYNITIGQNVKIHEVDGREVGDFDLTFS
ncbi:MAG: heme NO-binding domain-containing protein, partial [Bacteroidia bacterium]|nr:heme NO-binding domain-containing protein [Bacteroidia bacterium]